MATTIFRSEDEKYVSVLPSMTSEQLLKKIEEAFMDVDDNVVDEDGLEYESWFGYATDHFKEACQRANLEISDYSKFKEKLLLNNNHVKSKIVLNKKALDDNETRTNFEIKLLIKTEYGPKGFMLLDRFNAVTAKKCDEIPKDMPVYETSIDGLSVSVWDDWETIHYCAQ